jgi:hypothetical protein
VIGKSGSTPDEGPQNISIDKPNLALIIQGPFNQRVVDTVEKNLMSKTFHKIVVSTWENDSSVATESLSKFVRSGGGKVELVFSTLEMLELCKAPESLKYQVTTRLNGLEKIRADYCVMQRSDESYSLDGFASRLLNPEVIGKILFSNFIVRPFGEYPFHISDHLFGGPTQLLKLALSNISLHGISRVTEALSLAGGNRHAPPETLLGAELMKTFMEDPASMDNAGLWKVFVRHFEMFDLDDSDSFFVTARRAGVEWDQSLQELGKLRNPKANAIDFVHYRRIEELRPRPKFIHTLGIVFRNFARTHVPSRTEPRI